MLPLDLSRCRRLIFFLYLSSRFVDSAAIVRQIELQRTRSAQLPESILGGIERREDVRGIAAGIVLREKHASVNFSPLGPTPGPNSSSSSTPTPATVSSTVPSPPPAPSSFSPPTLTSATRRPDKSRVPPPTQTLSSSSPPIPTSSTPPPAPSSFSSQQGTTLTTGTSTQSAASFIPPGPSNLPLEHHHDHNQSIRIAVPISVVGFILAIGLVLWRRRHTAEKDFSGLRRRVKPQSLPTPFQLTAADLDLESRGNRANRLKTPLQAATINAISTRQAYISSQVNRVREKVAELEAETSTLLRQPSRSSHPESILLAETGDIIQPDELNPGPANDQRLERAVQQIEELNGRIRNLESQRRFSWALGLSDAPPPEYIE
ncbi:hypothetical protein C8R46DRAFT_1355606 [Mycena filopes]|nr:hypothetical protein C8R46DRAFT_1355606 [Mycena filopes]